MASASSVSSFAADPPLIKPFPSQFGDDSVTESENLLDLCAKILIDVEATVMATNSLISAIYEALDAPLFGESKVCKLDSSFSKTFATDFVGLDSDFDESIVPETAFDDMELEGFVPGSEDEGVAEAGGGFFRRTSRSECIGDGGGGSAIGFAALLS